MNVGVSTVTASEQDVRSGPRTSPADAFHRHRSLLFSLVYNLLGTVADTEDVLQDAWLSWSRAEYGKIENERAYLVRIAVNRALACLQSERVSREQYVGTWLPEPIVTEGQAEESALRGENVSLAMMVVLETLSPLERAVFVLHEAFGYEYVEIAYMLDRTNDAVRQLAHRARKRVRDRRPRYRSDSDAVRAATQRFLDAALGSDLEALMEILAPDVQLWSDGGGKLRTALRVIEGRDKFLRLVAATAQRLPAAMSTEYLEINGAPAALLSAESRLWGVIALDLRPDGRVESIYNVLNPDKLRALT
ncbi:hypothetical protein B7767_09100 [Streptomyces sp. 13-12-16]|jgi:RNA polymerase sigma-70 factor (ECF subfamily)|nr:hypothetical protein B7767_09100 [Streptomyces sp. 13-12-16]